MKVLGTRYASLLAVVLALETTGPALAATSLSHHGHGEGAVQLSFGNRAKWQTDEALRRGMTAVRAQMVEVPDRVHHGWYGAEEYAALAGRVEEHVDDVVKNCHRPGDADAQLHVVLAEIIDGIEEMLLARATTPPKFREQCGIRHVKAADLARDALIVRDGELLGRYTGLRVSNFLRGHGRLDEAGGSLLHRASATCEREVHHP